MGAGACRSSRAKASTWVFRQPPPWALDSLSTCSKQSEHVVEGPVVSPARGAWRGAQQLAVRGARTPLRGRVEALGVGSVQDRVADVRDEKEPAPRGSPKPRGEDEVHHGLVDSTTSLGDPHLTTIFFDLDGNKETMLARSTWAVASDPVQPAASPRAPASLFPCSVFRLSESSGQRCWFAPSSSGQTVPASSCNTSYSLPSSSCNTVPSSSSNTSCVRHPHVTPHAYGDFSVPLYLVPGRCGRAQVNMRGSGDDAPAARR
jgi:hypothetical protein